MEAGIIKGDLSTPPEEIEVVIRSIRDLEAAVRALRGYYANQASRVSELERKAKEQETQMKHQEAVAAGLLRKRRARMLRADDDDCAARRDGLIHGGAAHTSPPRRRRQGMEVLGRNKIDSPLAAQPDSRGKQSTTGTTLTRVTTPVFSPIGRTLSAPRTAGIHPIEPSGQLNSADSATSTTGTGTGTIGAPVSSRGVWDNDIIPAHRASREKQESAATAICAAGASVSRVECARSAIVPPMTSRRVEVLPGPRPATLEAKNKTSLPSGNETLCSAVRSVAQEKEGRSLDATPLHTGNGEAKGKIRSKQKKRIETEARTKQSLSLGGRKKKRARFAGSFAKDLGIDIPIADRLGGNAEGPIVSTVRPVSGETKEGNVPVDLQSEWTLLHQLGEVAREFA